MPLQCPPTRSFAAALFLGALLLLASGCSPATQAPTPTPSPTATRAAPTPIPVPTLTVAELKALLDSKERPIVYDARTPEEYVVGHLPGAVSMPLDEMEGEIDTIPRDRLVVFYCHGGT